MKKICTGCLIPKKLSEYFKQSHGKNGVRSRCKECCGKYANNYAALNRERKNQLQRNYTKRKTENDSEFYKNQWKKFGERENKRRNYKYHNDPLFRLQKQIHDDLRKECGDLKKSYERNKDKAIKRSRVWKLNNEAHVKKTTAAYRNKNRSRLIKLESIKRNNLDDTYIKQIICRDRKLTRRDIPQELINLTRAKVLLHREIRKMV